MFQYFTLNLALQHRTHCGAAAVQVVFSTDMSQNLCFCDTIVHAMMTPLNTAWGTIKTVASQTDLSLSASAKLHDLGSLGITKILNIMLLRVSWDATINF